MSPRHEAPRRPTSTPDSAHDRSAELRRDVEEAGYHPDVVLAATADALAGEPVLAHVVQHEPTFDREEIRRHLTALVLTPTRLVVTHTDENPADDLLPEPYTSTSCEAVSLSAVQSVVVTRMTPVASPARGKGRPADAAEAVLTVAWGAVQRVELEPAACSDPTCDADHGYSGSISGDDFSLRVSATADGGDAVGRLLDFGRRLSAVTVGR